MSSLARFDWKNPNYTQVFQQRVDRLKRLRADPGLMRAVKQHYRKNPADFINDWGMTYDPRNIAVGISPNVPFILWPRQREFIEWLYSRWKDQRRGMVEKSRDMGITWLSAGFASSMWLFEPGFAAGFGSRKEDLVDRSGDMDSIFEKIRFFINNLPRDFRPAEYGSAHMRVTNPENNASITGEAGDDIGRGGRKSIYLVDEKAFIERQKKVDNALSQTTNCQIDMSTPNGSGNEFYKLRQRFNNTDALFIFDWRQDPRKDDAWYQKQLEEKDEVSVAQEINRDYNASAEDSFIPAKWVAAAVDAHKKLGFRPEGLRVTSFDPADVGDAKAVANRHGSIIQNVQQLKRGDITQAMPWAFDIADQFRADVLVYDGDGMGAPTMKLTLPNMAVGRMKVIAYHGSAGVVDPARKQGDTGKRKLKSRDKRMADLHSDKGDPAGRTNADMFANFRAQSWTWARQRFELTFEAIQRANQGQIVNVDPDDLISISSDCECLMELTSELSRPMRKFTNNGKIKVESKEDMKARQVDSPNLADALVMAMSVRRPEAEAKPKPKFETYSPFDKGMGV